jgi:hypothetical protein
MLRVSSGTVSGSATTEPYLYLPTSINTTAYDQAQNLITNQDLQIANGLYQTKAGSPNAYLNYTPTYYGPTSQNLYDYSNNSSIPPTGYRYATFCLRPEVNNDESYVRIQFQINNVQQTIAYQNGDGQLPMVGSSRLYFYYRIKDNRSDTYSSSFMNTPWFDATKISDFDVMTFFNNSLVLSAGNGSVYSGNTYTINCKVPQLTVRTAEIYYVYFRVCAPMNTAFSFSSVSAQFTRS